MALDTTLFKHLLNVKGTVVEDIEFFHETDGTKSAVVQVHATRGYRCRCRFRNVENLKAMVLLCCSNLVIPLPNHAVSGKPAFLPGLKPRASCGKFCEEGLVQNKELQENLAELKANQAVPLPGEEEKAEKPEKDEKPEKAEKAEEPAKKDAAS